MIMVDTNVVIDLLEGDARWSAWARDVLLLALDRDDVSASAIVIGEIASRFDDAAAAVEALRDFQIAVESFGPEPSYRAGLTHVAYRRAGGGRERILADFMIGAHAVDRRADLLTRDIRRYRAYFPNLPLITPETDHG